MGNFYIQCTFISNISKSTRFYVSHSTVMHNELSVDDGNHAREGSARQRGKALPRTIGVVKAMTSSRKRQFNER
jgi:hypothetical protein